uniref:HDC05687 n=1 Tax=Drosophila melanogaster TaxID=7227 RepID=Q6IGQ7_DROME|nr:TPA_inf: HDC05687 [Drosophila melanogaster]
MKANRQATNPHRSCKQSAGAGKSALKENLNQLEAPAEGLSSSLSSRQLKTTGRHEEFLHLQETACGESC